jgi:hypothetical protein
MRWVGFIFSGAVGLLLAGCGGDSFGTSGDSDAGADAVSEQPVEDVSSDTGSETGPEASPDSPEDVVTSGLDLSPSSHTFSAGIGTTSAPFSFVVTNTGTTPTGSISANIDSQAFQVEHSTCTTLVPNASCEVNVVFAPATGGTALSTLTVEASPGGTVTASLVGEAGVVSNGLAFDPPTYDFHAVQYGATRFVSFDVTNTGGGVVQNIAFEVVVPVGAPVFSVASNSCPASLGEGDTCSVTVQYVPVASEPGKKTGELRATAGSALATAMVSGHTPDVFVRTNGDDNADGLSVPTAFRTIGRGLSNAETGWNVRVLPGVYAGENFPLAVNGVRLLGAGSGTDATSTRIAFEGSTKEVIRIEGIRPALEAVRIIATVPGSTDSTAVIGMPDDQVRVTNAVLELGTGWTGFGTNTPDDAAFDVDGLRVLCGNAAGNAIGIAVYGRAVLSLRNTELNACKKGMTVDGNAKVTVRDTHFIEIGGDAVSLSSTLASLDMGTADPAAPGNNVFQSGANTFTALRVSSLGAVDASGNTWLHNVQGADAQGHYEAGTLKLGPTPTASGGSNFVLITGSSVRL